jgi:anthranilate phosphoribosyltransferase
MFPVFPARFLTVAVWLSYANLRESGRNPHYIMSLLPYLHRISTHEHLSSEEARAAMEIILEGGSTTPLVAAFLVALKMKGEHADEVLGFAQAMRARVERVDCDNNGTPLIDTCGTGGDGLCTFNISTVAAFVIAGAGVRVAKHGNRSFSSKCGSADVLEQLGVRIELTPQQVADAIADAGIGFLFAPGHHPAMKHAQPARVELKMRTAFNLLGPLTNPAGARSQLIGVSSEKGADLVAHALAGLGTEHSFVVHGLDGLDEVSTTGPTLVYEIRGEEVRKHMWTPADFGVRRAVLAELEGGGPETNARMAREILSGAPGAPRDIVVANAAAALVAAGKAADLRSGALLAEESIDSGAAATRLERLVRFTNDFLHAGTNAAS